MENELNYLSSKIEELDLQREFREGISRSSENPATRLHCSEIVEELSIEIEYLENILNAITINALS